MSEFAGWATDDLIAFLEARRDALTSAYEASVYSGEITFEEYFMWWYHFFYSAITDALVTEGVIEIPAAGVATYSLVAQ